MGRFGWSKSAGVALSLLLGGCGQEEAAELESPWSAPEPVSDARSELAISPRAAAHPAGVHLVWTEGTEEVMTLRARHFDIGSSQWGETRDLGPADAAFLGTGPAVAADSAGNAVVVWQGEDEASIWAARYSRDKDRWSEPSLLDAGGDQPHVVMDADGNALALWAHLKDELQIYAAHMTPEGTWSSGQPIDTTTETASLQTDLVLHADGDATAFMIQGVEGDEDYSGMQLAAVRYIRDQDAWTPPVALQRVEFREYFDVSLAGNAQGDAVLVWSVVSDETIQQPPMYTAVYDSSSGAWTEPERLTTVHACRRAVMMDNNGRATLVCSYFEGQGGEVNAIRLDRGDPFALERVVTREDARVWDPAALALEDGMMVVWSEGPDLDTTLQSSSFRDGGWQAPERVGRARGGALETGLVNLPDVGVLTYWTTTGEIVTSWHP